MSAPHSVDNALFQWREGERRVAGAAEPARADLELVVEALVEELRRRLGSSFTLGELVDLYGEGTDWATQMAGRRGAGVDGAAVADAAFARYAREASDFAGGRPRETHEKP